jgi:ABC-2 type transport system permease protein
MRVLELAKRNLKEILRDRISMAFLIGMPVVFMLIFGFAFRGMNVQALSLGVVDLDNTPTSNAFAAQYLGNITALDTSAYNSESEAIEELRFGDLDGVLIIPQGFENAVQAKQGINLTLFYDETKLAVGERLVSIVNSAAITFYEAIIGTHIPVNIAAHPSHTEGIGYMNILGPGMTVFGLLILIPTAASLITRDKEMGIMPRLLTTPLKPWQFITGYSLPYIIVLVIQIGIYIGIAYALGLKIVGDFGLAFAVLFLLGLSSVALGIILATFIRHEGQAHISWILIVPMAMLSGAWFSTEGMNPVMIAVAKAFPPTYAVRATQDVISRGLGFGAIATDFYILLGFAVGLFIIGAMLFRRRMLT